mmetsp:Transcript_12453/g.34967  ORF Transcript_12453/g.34967 Transcript_12453/m.34967 type:complete len:262 (+) Transcript_12453:1153-1938(+)
MGHGILPASKRLRGSGLLHSHGAGEHRHHGGECLVCCYCCCGAMQGCVCGGGSADHGQNRAPTSTHRVVRGSRRRPADAGSGLYRIPHHPRACRRWPVRLHGLVQRGVGPADRRPSGRGVPSSHQGDCRWHRLVIEPPHQRHRGARFCPYVGGARPWRRILRLLLCVGCCPCLLKVCCPGDDGHHIRGHHTDLREAGGREVKFPPCAAQHPRLGRPLQKRQRHSVSGIAALRATLLPWVHIFSLIPTWILCGGQYFETTPS